MLFLSAENPFFSLTTCPEAFGRQNQCSSMLYRPYTVLDIVQKLHHHFQILRSVESCWLVWFDLVNVGAAGQSVPSSTDRITEGLGDIKQLVVPFLPNPCLFLSLVKFHCQLVRIPELFSNSHYFYLFIKLLDFRLQRRDNRSVHICTLYLLFQLDNPL